MKHLPSIFTDEQELLKAILDIHNKGESIELDPMFNKGKFYKKLISEPHYKFDLNPIVSGVIQADARHLSFPNGLISSMILDPPFLFNKYDKGTSNIIKRYTRYEDQSELHLEYHKLIKEAYRVLENKGLLIFKCQDLTTGGKTYMNHILVANLLVARGFYIKDLVLLNKENKIYKPDTTQRHFRKTHTYFYVAIKKGK